MFKYEFVANLPVSLSAKKNFENRLTFGEVMVRVQCLVFLTHGIVVVAAAAAAAVVVTTQPLVKYVATLPYNLSLIACFLIPMFHKVVWQHTKGVVEFLTTTLLQIYRGIF